eukprot:TRINITY_DN75448_c0_g1_i2.p1 TRINITY_DN75448_c0_g1~~TRINITY_DN75448_c0_g1_i2.p1  ORF type:complete len:161 (-),score=4.79 TRINITY_DN75448_c0_g1_i2:133-615(-)
MKTLIRTISILCVFCLPSVAFSQEQCSNISCDCSSLPTKSWVQTCQNQEARIIADCVKNKNETLGFCSLHGPMANRLPLDLDIKETELFALEEVPGLNNKVAALYWAIIKDFDSFEVDLKKAEYERASDKLKTIENNVNQLFTIQQTVANSFIADKKSEK